MRLPPNLFGLAIMLALIGLVFLAFFVSALWALGLLGAPWWVSVPVSLVVALVITSLFVTVERDRNAGD